MKLLILVSIYDQVSSIKEVEIGNRINAEFVFQGLLLDGTTINNRFSVNYNLYKFHPDLVLSRKRA